MVNRTFSEGRYSGPFPSIQKGDTYRSYRKRVDEAKAQGFHLGDLGWGTQWDAYCKGSGMYEGVDADQLIDE